MAIDPRLQQGQPQPNRVEGMQDLQGIAQSRTLRDDAQMVRGMPPKPPMSPGGMGGVVPSQPMMSPPPPMMQQPPQLQSRMPTDNEITKGILMALIEKRAVDAGINAEESIRELMAISDMEKAKSAPPPQRGLSMSAAPAIQQAMNDPITAAQSGGLMQLAAKDEPMPVQQSMPIQQVARGGGVDNFAGQVPGQGHGMEDNVYMPIVERNRGQQVATLAVSPDEYVVDAHTMSALGNGSADEGARYMDGMVKNIREKAYGTDEQPNEINGLAALRPMIERV
jgi:hypothetical protein